MENSSISFNGAPFVKSLIIIKNLLFTTNKKNYITKYLKIQIFCARIKLVDKYDNIYGKVADFGSYERSELEPTES